jgi:hypothetical protein
MANPNEILYVSDAGGDIVSVIVPIALWRDIVEAQDRHEDSLKPQTPPCSHAANS